MTKDEERKILALEEEAGEVGYALLEYTLTAGEEELTNRFRWIAHHLRQTIREETPAKRRPLRQEISKRTKELSDVVRERYNQHKLPFRCINDYDECVRERKREKKSPYLCSVALFICLTNSVKVLVTAVAAGAGAGGLLR